MPESIAVRVATVIAKAQHIPADSVTAEKSFAELGIDSLDGMSIIFSLEEEFAIDIPEEEAKTYTTVARAIEAITLLMDQKSAASQA